ncbi:unannotated protein [freshwater metagenome]|uniref:Unannotated protein n=1 Tax=freshwater metagenome TaxID=449393 RepID=A0A6J7ERG3_9ZZZZ|nr:hypothetical protein [Actinomycetota bacterium]
MTLASGGDPVVYTAALSDWTPASGAGHYLLHAAYSGDDNFEPSFDGGTNESFTVTKVTATLSAITSVTGSYVPGDPITLGATVSPAGCTGPVTYSLDKSPLNGAAGP